MQKIKSEKSIRNAIVMALHVRHSGGQRVQTSRNKRRQTKHSWKKEQW